MRPSLVAARWRATPSVDRGYRARQHSTASAEVLVRRQWRWRWCGVPPAVRERCPMRIMLLLFKKKKIKRGSAAIKQDSDACWRVCRGCVAHDRPLAMSRERSAITETPQVCTSGVNNFPCAGKRRFPSQGGGNVGRPPAKLLGMFSRANRYIRKSAGHRVFP